MHHAFSAETIAPIDPSEKIQPAKLDEDNRVISPSSEGNRKNLTAQLSVAFLGREYIGSHPTTFSLGYFLRPNDLLTLRYSIFNGKYSEAAQKLRAVTLGYRSFLSNSFNVMPSLYYRRNTASFNKTPTLFSPGNGKLIYEDVGVGIRIGNEWQWEHFTLGCDWLGANYTAKVLNHYERSLGTFEDLSFAKSLTLTYLSFYMGFSF